MSHKKLQQVLCENVAKGTSGVYQIRCSDGRIYIGSSVDIRSRWAHHLHSLQHNSHSNSRLQAAWNNTDSTFAFSVLENAARNELFTAEQAWIDKTRCADITLGFNIFDKAGSPGGCLAQTWEGFIDPQGNPITIHNLFAFCREHQLDFPSMHRLSIGKSKLKSYKGWTHCNSIRIRDYVKIYEGFIDPQGNQVDTIVNLAAFCRDHNLDDTHMLALARGRICSYRGWTHVNSPDRKDIKTYHGFVRPNGKQIVITNLSKFCRENNLQIVKMYNLKSGKIRQHKGWTWKGEINDRT